MLDIPATKSTPHIVYSEEEHRLSIIGESYPENTFAFYDPVFAWLHEHLPALDQINLHVNIKYMNSSSTKCMLDILDLLGESAKKGCTVSVSWFYETDNERALDIAGEFEEDVDIIPIKASES